MPQSICNACHAPVQPEFYFCPNCGNNLRPAPLSTTLSSQLLVYAHSIILPFFLFITISHWKGTQYLKSKDPNERQIGMIAIALLVVSTIGTFWYAYVWTQAAMQQAIQAVNVDFGL